MPVLTVVTDEPGGYVYLLSPKHDPLPERARILIKYPASLAAQFGEEYDGLPCAAWRVEWHRAAELKATLEANGYYTKRRTLDDFAPHGPSVLECPACGGARRSTESGACPWCGDLRPPARPPAAPEHPSPPQPGWLDSLRGLLPRDPDDDPDDGG